MAIANDARREEILAIAAELFAERGYGLTSIRDIASAAGISQATLYYYIGCKQDLLVDLHNSYIEELLQRLPEVVEADAPPEEKLRGLIRTLMESHERNHMQMAAFLRERRSLSPEAAAKVQEKRDQVDRMLDQVLAEGIAAGRFRGPPIKSVRLAILGMISWAVEWFSPSGPWTAQQFAEDFTDLVLWGLSGGAAERPASGRGGRRALQATRP